jgi:transposase
MQAMKTTTSPMPNDPKILQKMMAQMQAKLDSQESLIATLRHQLAVLKRSRFGRSSEQVDKQIHQLELQLEELEIHAAELPELDLGERAEKATPRRRQQLPKHLPREETHVEAPHACPDCQGELTHVGEDVSEILDVVPASYRVLKIVRPKFSCPCCQTMVQGEAPQRVIPKGFASAALIGQVLLDKYLDHQPLYRQSQKMEREEIDIERSTLCDWVGKSSHLLTPLADAIGKYVKQAKHIHGDDTTAPTLSPGKGRTQTGRYWTYVRDGRPWGEEAPPAVWLQYSEDRKSVHPTAHLKGFTGSMQADAYAGYNDVYRKNVTFVACWAHARRKFIEVSESGPSPIADKAIAFIQSLYAIEKSIKGKPPDIRQQIRTQQALPILETFYEWLQTTLRTLSKGSAISKAVNYTLKQWEGLNAYVHDGHADIDNNSAERSLRPIALGRKNYLFAGSPAGGKRAAVLYSIISTANLNGINPRKYLTAVLKRIGQHPINKIDELLPWKIDLAMTSETDAL